MRLLRVFVIFLMAIFLADSVYAAGMIMPVPEASSAHEDMHMQHCHDMGKMEMSMSQHDDKHPAKSHGKCHDCLACLTMLPASQHKLVNDAAPAIMISLYFIEYVSPITPLLDRPPISFQTI